MIGFVIAALIVAVMVLLMWLIDKAIDGSVMAGAAAIGLCIVIVGVVLNVATKEKGPCHQWETRLMYNAATKTMMPSRVCVLRGEWVETSHDNQ